jgi:predicted amidohydrolase YtcJ
MDLIDARLWTGNLSQPWAEAMAVNGDTIALVGITAKVQKLTDENTEAIDVKGQLNTPGFIDSSIHFIDGGFRLASVQLRDARIPEEFISRIADFTKTVAPGT